MDQMKRSLNFNESSNEITKKLRTESNKSIISIENLSDELFHEMFDYLDGCTTYQAFSNLNRRFQQLLRSSSLLFKIAFPDTQSEKMLMNNNQRIHFKRYQIFSIYSWKPSKDHYLYSKFISDLSLTRLESLVFEIADPDVLMSILCKLKSFPRLFSLTITHPNDLIDLTDIYRIILSLSALKYYKFVTNKPYLSILLPMATNKQLNAIEHLIIDHHCTFDEISMITSYTPKLKRLYFMNELESDDTKIEISLSLMTLSNLTHLSIRDYYKNFNEFEIFISKLNSKLKSLSFTTQSSNTVYLDVYQWENLILKYLPQLEKFYLQYTEHITNEYKCSRKQNQFSSSFWIERQWIMEVEIADEYITYIVRSYRKSWYENIINSSVEFSKFTQPTLIYFSSNEHNAIIGIDCKRILSSAQIYHLEIAEEKIFIGILIQMINLLPDLNSLRVYSLSFDGPRSLSAEELVILCSISNKCKITKVYLEKMDEIEQVYLFMTLCPYLTYLKVGFINNINIELFLRNILKKINDRCNNHLRSLCFHIPIADDKLVKKFEQIINTEKLLFDFQIKRILDCIYLQWT